ncbi:MAG: TetR/AcrR family transcriptional regulator [Propionicimonas sp.]
MSDRPAARWLPREPGNVRGRATADRLTLAALEVAERQGVQATTIDEICQVAGCSRRTFFHHFPSREAALLGPAVPTVPPESVARYLAEPVPILAGAIDLVVVPEEMRPSSPLGARRHALLRTSPQLQAAARERMTPAATTVLAAVTAKVAQLPGIAPDDVRPIAEAVTLIAAALIQSAYADGDNDPSDTLRRLGPVWSGLIH